MTFTQPAPTVPPTSSTSGIAVAALVVGIAAFVFGLVPVFGLLVALAGLVVGIIALSKGGPKLMPGIGIALSAVAALANVVMMVVVFILIPASVGTVIDDALENAEEYAYEEEDDSAVESDELSLTPSETPCFTFEAPTEFISNQSADDDALCLATRQGWGELNDDGTITYTGVGAIWDQVLVEPVRVETSDTMAPDGELDTMVAYLETNYFPQLGEVISLTEPYELDGQPANLTRFDSPSETTVTKATLVVKSPEPYETANGPVQFFLITFVIDDERGDEIIDALVDSFTWQ